MTINIGDVVRLNVGGPEMVVASQDQNGYRCIWIPSGQTSREDTFDASQLTIIRAKNSIDILEEAISGDIVTLESHPDIDWSVTEQYKDLDADSRPGLFDGSLYGGDVADDVTCERFVDDEIDMITVKRASLRKYHDN